MIRFLEGVFILAGMIIGVGMFAIPFSFAAAGFWLGALELAALSCLVVILHLLYGKIVLVTPEFHRMPGYVRHYLGRRAEMVSWASTLFGTVGTLVAYLAVGALFLQNILSSVFPGAGVFSYVVFLALTVSAITFFPLKKEAHINGILTIFEIAFIALLAFFLLPKISPAHLHGFHPQNIFIPYGVLLFALSGGSVIPDVITVLGRGKKRVTRAIVAGSLIPAILYFFFAFGVVGVSGRATTSEAIAGLRSVIGERIVFLGSVAGFLAVLTSFIALSANFQALLRLDMKIPRRAAWLGASVIPFFLYTAGFQNFIVIIGVVGAVAFGVDSALFLLMGRKIAKKQGGRGLIPPWANYSILAIIIVGILAELLRII